MSYYETVKTQFGEFQSEGDDAWLCDYDYDNHSFELIVAD